MNNSKWCSGAGPLWLEVDLGSSQTVKAFVIDHSALGGENTVWNTSAFTIETSTDNSSWTQRVSVTGNQKSRTVHTINPVTARYVRLNIATPTSNGNATARIYEFEVH